MVLIPTEAIVTNGQLSGVYTVSQSNTAMLRWLRLGRTFGDQVEVLSGLNADEAYIVSAEGKLLMEQNFNSITKSALRIAVEILSSSEFAAMYEQKKIERIAC